MTIFKNYSSENYKTLFLLMIVATFTLLQSCKKSKKESQTNTVEVKQEQVIEIITENMDFQMPDTITSGWNTFRYKNLSTQTHFFLIDKYPEGKNSDDAKNLVAPVFESAMKLITAGKTEEGYAEFAKLPEWFGEVVFVGGSGLLSPHQIGETTLHVKPGKYIIECYVKMSNGAFHTSMGMTKDIVVTEMDSGNTPPQSDIDISISSTGGIIIKDTITAGKQTFSVSFEDQITHEHFLGHDINLVKLHAEANLKALENWMNWADPKGLIEPAPTGITFLGGVNDMPAGSIAYFTATLDAGKYALISEVPKSLEKNMLKTFEVSK